MRSQKRDLKQNKGKTNKDKSGLLDLIFKKEQKRYTVEDTIPYLRLLKSGICQLDEKHFSKSIAFQDINYQLALDEDRDLIFNQFANFLNSFDPSVSIEFSYKDLKKKESTKIYIVPDEFNFMPSRYFKFGKFIGATSHFQILASELSDRMLSEFLDIDDNINISFHIRAIDQSEAIKMVKRKNTDIDKMRIEENKKAVRSGYDMDILPSDLITYGEDVKSLLKDLQTRDERMFVVSIVFMNFVRTVQKLDNTIAQISSIANKHNCKIKRLDHTQEQGLISVLPLGVNKIEIDRGLTSSSTAVFMPFTTEELFINSSNSLYYGLNALSHNLIMADRKKLKNPNGLILGTPGSGKSFSAKREMANAILVTDDDVIICDPEGEVRQEVVL